MSAQTLITYQKEGLKGQKIFSDVVHSVIFLTETFLMSACILLKKYSIVLILLWKAT